MKEEIKKEVPIEEMTREMLLDRILSRIVKAPENLLYSFDGQLRGFEMAGALYGKSNSNKQSA